MGTVLVGAIAIVFALTLITALIAVAIMIINEMLDVVFDVRLKSIFTRRNRGGG